MSDIYGDWYGFDFGTSNTVISILKNGEAFSLPINENNEDSEIFQSAICYFEGKQYFGIEAIEKYLKEIINEEDKSKNSDVRLIRSFKSLLGRNTEIKTSIDGKIYTIGDIVASYFTEVKMRADKIVGKDIKKIIVGRPVKFVGQENNNGNIAQEIIEECLIKAGFDTVSFEYEPVAAARRYANVAKGKVLVFDFGGGTLDVALVDLDTNHLLAFEGESAGGDLIDYMIYDTYFSKYFGRDLKYRKAELSYPVWAVEKVFDWSEIIGLRNNDFYTFLASLRNRSSSDETVKFIDYFIKHNLTYSFRKNVIQAKVCLSDSDHADFCFVCPTKKIEDRIDRKDFEDGLVEYAEIVEIVLDKVLSKSGLAKSTIDKVVMTGGSSLIPFFQNLLANEFGKDKVMLFEPFTSVSKGLVLMGLSEGNFSR
ncbi:MAG TPA: Hsp70 family protein [Spirochaetia bacterium]|nr:Hsp70 family protein [Spirochaetia bacterium]